MEKIRIVIIEDDRIARTALLANLSRFDEILILGDADNVKDAFELITKEKPDVALIDYQMRNDPGPDGRELVQQVKALCPTMKIITVTGLKDPYALSLAREFGANSIIHKDEATNYKYVLEVIQKTVQGAEEESRPKMHELDSKIDKATLVRREFENILNNTQRKVIALMADHKKASEIAKIVGKSEGHIRTARSQAIKKLLHKEKLVEGTEEELIAYYKKLYPK